MSQRPARTVNLEKDPTGAPAVNLEKVRQAGHVDLAKTADKAGLALSKRDLAGIRAQAVLVLDHSGSMRSDYASGVVQKLVERALGFALQIDVDGKIPVIPFDTRVLPTVEVDVNNYRGVVQNRIWKPNNMGYTNMADALKVVRNMSEVTDAPIFCIFVTDGEPYTGGRGDDEAQTTEVVCDLARYPVFLKFLTVRPVAYLQKLDDLPNSARLLDNVDTKDVPNPDSMTDLAFADAMVDEWDSWITAAKAAGTLV